MTENIKLSLDLVNESSCSDLTVQLLIDDICFYNQKVTPGTHHVTHEVQLEPGEHTFNIVLDGKNETHTTVDDNGNITEDVLIRVIEFEVEEINLDWYLWQLGTYKHNYNGFGESVESKFFGVLGCNGIVTLNFTSPMYLWILEHM